VRATLCVTTLIGALLCLGSIGRADFRHDVTRVQLDNGLTVLLYENHQTPVVSYYTFYKAGSRNERPGITGVSHVLEHMMFNGAKKYGPKMFDKMLESHGGYSNAYTTNDMTVYYENIAANNLELVVDMESDRMANLALDSAILESERSVIEQERLMRIDNNNGGLVYEELSAAVYMAHPYSWPVIGWMADIKQISREDCYKYYSTYYAPDNAVIVVTGDFQTQRAVKLITDYYQSIPASSPPPAVVEDEPEQRGPRRVELEKPAQYCHFVRGYHIGDKDDPDLYVMQIINSLLTTGESSLLYQSLVDSLQLSMGVYGDFNWAIDPSMYYVYIAGYPGVDVAQVEHAYDSVMAEFESSDISDTALLRAKNGLIADYYKGFETNSGIAGEIGFYEVLYGDWTKMYDYVDRIRAVTTADIKRVVARYLTDRNSTTVVLVPEGGSR
jgi:zinc protease